MGEASVQTLNKTEAEPGMGVSGKSLCGIIGPHLPSHCTCTDKHLGGDLSCSAFKVLGDTIGVAAKFEPCGDEAHMDVEITDSKFGIHYPIAGVQADKEETFAIPGVSLDVPFVGSVGLDVSVF